MNRNQFYQSQYYQKNQAKKKTDRIRRYQLAKKQQREQEVKQTSKYSQVENYKVLMTLKEYSLLNAQKHQKWLDFNWTLQDLATNGIHNTSEIMRLGELGEILIKDYRATAKKEVAKGKYWPSLAPEQQEKIIKYWGYKKARQENNLLTLAEQLEQQSEEYEKEIALAKFHEERGKIKCSCYSCSESQRLQGEIKRERKKALAEEKTTEVESECANCYEYKKVDADSGLCRKCQQESC